MPHLELKPTHKPVTAYYDSLAKFAKLGVKHEGAVRSAFDALLDHAAGAFGWKLVAGFAIPRKGAKPLFAEGALLDKFGLVCFVTNSGFVEGIAADGARKNLAKDFDLIYVLDLGGNVRKNPKLSGTTHNVFGIQVGVSVALLVRLPKPTLS